MSIGTLWDRTLGTLSWRFKSLIPARLYSFALAEHESMLELQVAANLTSDPDRAAAYLKHADDEAGHARMFYKMANELRRDLGQRALPPPRTGHAHWFQTFGEAAFLSLVHRGERRGRQQFEVYVNFFRARAQPKLAALFERILEDERRHEAYTGELLQEVHDAPGVRRAKLRVGLSRYRKLGDVIMNPCFAFLGSVLFFLSAPLALPVRLGAKPKSGWNNVSNSTTD